MNSPKLPMLKRSKSTSCFVFRNEVKRKTRSENDIQSDENSFEKRKSALLNKFVYKKDPSTESKIKKLKKNNQIAYVNNFNLKSYQKKILSVLSHDTSDDNLLKLKINLFSMNQSKIKNSLHPYVNLAKKLEFKVPKHLTDRLYSLGLKQKVQM